MKYRLISSAAILSAVAVALSGCDSDRASALQKISADESSLQQVGLVFSSNADHTYVWAKDAFTGFSSAHPDTQVGQLTDGLRYFILHARTTLKLFKTELPEGQITEFREKVKLCQAELAILDPIAAESPVSQLQHPGGQKLGWLLAPRSEKQRAVDLLEEVERSISQQYGFKTVEATTLDQLQWDDHYSEAFAKAHPTLRVSALAGCLKEYLKVSDDLTARYSNDELTDASEQFKSTTVIEEIEAKRALVSRLLQETKSVTGNTSLLDFVRKSV